MYHLLGDSGVGLQCPLKGAEGKCDTSGDTEPIWELAPELSEVERLAPNLKGRWRAEEKTNSRYSTTTTDSSIIKKLPTIVSVYSSALNDPSPWSQ